MTKITFLKLTKDDKAKLQKLAHAKELSLSTCANIIAKHLFLFVANDDKYYIQTNDTQTTIKIRNECNYEYTVAKISNCIVLYLHHEYLNTNIFKDKNNIEQQINEFWYHTNKEIQRDLDKTIDVNKNLNEEIRAYYRAKNHLERQRA